MKIVTGNNNFVRGKIDHSISGRFDLPIYQTGSEEFKNFIPTFMGSASFRTGLKSLVMLDAEYVMIEFKFNIEQSYIVLFGEKKIDFAAFDSNNDFVVLSGSTIVSPYTLAQAREIQVTQTADTMIITHQLFKPRVLKRVNATTFTLSDVSFINGPYLPINGTNITITPSATTGTITLTASASLFTANDVGRLVKFKYFSPQRIRYVKITGYTSATQVTAVVQTALVAGTKVSWYLGAFYGVEGSSNTARYPRSCLFYGGRLWFANTLERPTTVWGSRGDIVFDFGFEDELEVTKATDSVEVTMTDLNEEIYWLFAGSGSLILGSRQGIATLNGGGSYKAITPSDTISPNINSPDGCNNSLPILKDSSILYLGTDDRLCFSFNYDLLSESFRSDNLNLVSYDWTYKGLKQLKHKRDKYDLVYSLLEDGQFAILSYSKVENITGWSVCNTDGNIKNIATITDNFGVPYMFFLVERYGTYFIECESKPVDFLNRYDFYTGNQENDDLAFARLSMEKMRNCFYLDGAFEYEDKRTSTITYDPTTETITSTGADFNASSVGKRIEYITSTGYEHGLFNIYEYIDANNVKANTINGSPSTNTYSSWRLSFDELTTLATFLFDETVTVVSDGAYLGEYTFDGSGKLELPIDCFKIIFGKPYCGFIKSFNLGFQVDGTNTIITPKRVNQVSFNLINSAGGKVGTDLYNMQDIQLKDVYKEYYNINSVPLDGIFDISITDSYNNSKNYYIQQDKPLPFEVSGVFVKADYNGET